MVGFSEPKENQVQKVWLIEKWVLHISFDIFLLPTFPNLIESCVYGMKSWLEKRWWGPVGRSSDEEKQFQPCFSKQGLKNTHTSLQLEGYLSCCPVAGTKWKVYHLSKKEHCLIFRQVCSFQHLQLFSVILPCQFLPVALLCVILRFPARRWACGDCALLICVSTSLVPTQAWHLAFLEPIHQEVVQTKSIILSVAKLTLTPWFSAEMLFFFF